MGNEKENTNFVDVSLIYINMKNKKIIIAALKSEDNNKILSALKAVGENGDFTYFPFIMDIYKNNKNEEIHTSIFEILSDLNGNENAEYLVNYIQKENYESIKKELLTVCWNSRLDFSSHLTFFVNLFISDNFENSFDAFTIIENIKNLSDKEEIRVEILDTEIFKLKDSLTTISDDKKELLVQLVKILEDKKTSIYK